MIQKFTYYLFILFFISTASFGSNGPVPGKTSQQQEETGISVEMFSLFMAVQKELPADEVKAFWKDLNHFTEKLDRKRAKYKDEERFVRYLFYKVHRTYLKSYRNYANMYQLFEDGSYNCVTGTALYALLLDAFGLPYQIRETPYHVFLVVYPSQNTDSVLLESTDPNGFVAGQERMAQAIEFYKNTQVEAGSNVSFNYSYRIDENIDLQQLAGLNYFNQAVDHYNQQQLPEAMQYLNQAMMLYPARRMETFQSIIIQTAQKLSYAH